MKKVEKLTGNSIRLNFVKITSIPNPVKVIVIIAHTNVEISAVAK